MDNNIVDIFLEQKDNGWSVYEAIDHRLCTRIKWIVPDELFRNKYVEKRINSDKIIELMRCMDDIKGCNTRLSKVLLDIERLPITILKKELKDRCNQILDFINKDLSPYHWEISKRDNDEILRYRNCDVWLRSGEDVMKKYIDKL